jgi:hypothetical protein
MAGTTWNQGKCSIIEGEAMTLFEAMKEVDHKGFTQVIFETKNVVDAIHNLCVGNSEFSSFKFQGLKANKKTTKTNTKSKRNCKD